jgi:phosphomannomutase/phosphoglucomutase
LSGPLARFRRWGIDAQPSRRFEDVMFPKPKSALNPNTYAYESSPLVKPTGFREYDARWLLEKEINLMGVQALGMGLGTLVREMGVKPEIVTGHDFWSYSAAV